MGMMGTATAAVTTPMGTVLDELKQCDDGAQGESRERGKWGGSKRDKREPVSGGVRFTGARPRPTPPTPRPAVELDFLDIGSSAAKPRRAERSGRTPFRRLAMAKALACPLPRDAPALRLVCLPHAGGAPRASKLQLDGRRSGSHTAHKYMYAAGIGRA